MLPLLIEVPGALVTKRLLLKEVPGAHGGHVLVLLLIGFDHRKSNNREAGAKKNVTKVPYVRTRGSIVCRRGTHAVAHFYYCNA